MALSETAQKQKLDAIARALRPFGITDDGTISVLFASSALPDAKALIGVLRGRNLPSSTNLAFIASRVISEVRATDIPTSEMLDAIGSPPTDLLRSPVELSLVSRKIIQHFKHLVEEKDTWKLLWNGTKPGDEARCQIAFRTCAESWCRPYNIDVSPEVDVGRGLVDFKVSQGWKARALIEAKLASNSKFWDGIRKQLPRYMKSESISSGHFIAFAFTDYEISRVIEIHQVAQEVSLATGYEIDTVLIDARRENKKTGSKL